MVTVIRSRAILSVRCPLCGQLIGWNEFAAHLISVHGANPGVTQEHQDARVPGRASGALFGFEPAEYNPQVLDYLCPICHQRGVIAQFPNLEEFADHLRTVHGAS